MQMLTAHGANWCLDCVCLGAMSLPLTCNSGSIWECLSKSTHKTSRHNLNDIFLHTCNIKGWRIFVKWSLTTDLKLVCPIIWVKMLDTQQAEWTLSTSRAFPGLHTTLILSSRDQCSIQGTGGQRGGVLTAADQHSLGGQLQPGGAERHRQGSLWATALWGAINDSGLLPSFALFSFPLVIWPW